MSFFSSRFNSLSALLSPATNYFTVVFEKPGTYQLQGELTEFLSMDIYAWGAGGASSYGAAGGGGALVKLGGVTPPTGSILEITVGSSGSAGGHSQGVKSNSITYYTKQLASRPEWCDFLRNYAVWDGNGDYTWKAYFPTTGLYDIELSIDDIGKIYIDDVQVGATQSTAPAITSTLSITVDGAGGGGGGHDAGTPGHDGYAGARVTGTHNIVLGQDTLQIDIGTGGAGGGDSGGGGAGGRGTSIDYILFNLRNQTGNYSTSNGAYASWLNSYGVWESNNTAATFDRTYTVNFPFTGYYLFRVSCDNTGYVYLDGTQVATAPGFGTYYDHNVYVTAGNHTIRTYGVNSGGPASLGVVIYKASFMGGSGGNAGSRGSSGAGGGGGGATVLRKNSTTFLAVAAGGGGGGGAGNGPVGLGTQGTGLSNTWYTPDGADRGGTDGGGAGGGGGGVYGGKGGALDTSYDHAGYSGESGSSYSALTAGSTTANGAGNRGTTGNGAWTTGNTGGNGQVVITYTSPTGAQLYTGGTVTQSGSTFTHTFTSSGVFQPALNNGYAFVWNSQTTITEGWHTIKINATNTVNYAGVAGRIKQNGTSVVVWTSRDERDPSFQGTGNSYRGGPSDIGVEGSQLPLTDNTATGWMIGRHSGYTSTSGTYSITREFYVGRNTNYNFRYMVTRAGMAAVSSVSIKVDGTELGTSTTSGASPNTFTTALTAGFHTLVVTGDTGAGATNVYAALELDFTDDDVGLPLFSLYTSYISRSGTRGGRGQPSYDSDGDGDGPFSAGDGGGASVVRMNGTFLVIAGAGGGAGGSGDDYWTDGMQFGGGGRGEGTPSSSNGVGLPGSAPTYAGGAGGGGGGLNGGAGGAASSTHYPGNGGQGGTSFINRRVGTDWAVTAGAYNAPGGTTDVAFNMPFGYSDQAGRVVIVFFRKPHVWQKINGVWKRFDNLYVKKNSSKQDAILNLNAANWIAGANAEVREYTSVATLGSPNTNAIGSLIGVFGLHTTGSAEERTLSSREKIDLSAFSNLWFQVNMGTTANWGEVPESGENIKLQYSADGKTWTDIDSVAPSLAVNTWTSRAPAVPGSAKVAGGVYLRFYQSATFDAGYAVRDTWAFTSVMGLAALGDAPSAGRGSDIWKNVSNVWVKVQGAWKRIYTAVNTSNTPTPNRYG